MRITPTRTSATGRRSAPAVAEPLDSRRLLAVTTPAFATDYRQTWLQDFTAMDALSVSAHGPVGPGGSTWMAHKPGGGDWFTFADPVGPQNPFSLTDAGLAISVRKNGDPANGFSGYTGGLLSSIDDSGNGFAQQYGYFEASMKLPGGPNTWPAFWLVSRNGEVNKQIDVAEIDVMEAYGNWNAGPNNTPAGDPNHYIAGWHAWNADGTSAGNGQAIDGSGLATGYHTYGVDIEPSGITYYLDRQPVWTAPIYAAAKHPMYVLVDLALGGGNYNNATGTGYNWDLTPNPSNLDIQYVSVWASPASPNYSPVLSGIAAGDTVGTTGSYATGSTAVYTAPDGANAVFDNNASTFFDAPAATGGRGVWVGKDLGTPKLVTEISFVPRSTYEGRMTGGKFQVSNAADFSSGVLDLFVVSATPAAGVTTVAVNSGTAYRYVRFLSPDGGWGNVAEMSFNTLNPPGKIENLSASAAAGSPVTLSWDALAGATGYDVFRGTTPDGQGATPFAANVASTTFVDQSAVPGTTYYYTVAARNPSGTGPAGAEAAVSPKGSITVDLAGAVIGTQGSYSSGSVGGYAAPDGGAAAFDGNLNTFFDAPGSTGGSNVWIGLDLGAPKAVTQIRYAPRADFRGRMTGGKFQASNTADFSSGVVDLHTVTDEPAFALRTVTVPAGPAYRYVRYLSPSGGWGNVSEVVFRGLLTAATPEAPTSLFARVSSASQINLYWRDNADDETGYVVERYNAATGVWDLLATLDANATMYANGGLAAGTAYAYRVRAVRDSVLSDASNEVRATTRAGGAGTTRVVNVR